MQINYTRELGQFKSNINNREINESYVDEIVGSIEKYGFWPHEPIVVDKDMTVLEGHHRLEAAKKACVGVHYVENSIPGITPIEMSTTANRKKRWTVKEVCELRAKQSDEDYSKLVEFVEQTGIEFSAALPLCCKGVGPTSRSLAQGRVKSGTFQFEVDEKSQRIVDMIEILHRRGFPKIGSLRVVNSIAGAFVLADKGLIDEGRLVHAIKTSPWEPYADPYRRTIYSAVTMLEGMYNHRTLKKNKVHAWYELLNDIGGMQ